MFDPDSTIMLIFIILGVVVIILIKYLVFTFYFERIRVSNLTKEELKYDNIRAIYKKLKKGELPDDRKIKKYAFDIEKRVLTYDVLKRFNKTDLFPKDLLIIEKASESYLVNWLSMNDDFDSFPDEIEFDSKINFGVNSKVLIFKFKKYPEDWMKGYVCYKEHILDPYSIPDLIMSNFRNDLLPIAEIEKLLFTNS